MAENTAAKATAATPAPTRLRPAAGTPQRTWYDAASPPGRTAVTGTPSYPQYLAIAHKCGFPAASNVNKAYQILVCNGRNLGMSGDGLRAEARTGGQFGRPCSSRI